MTHEQQRRIIDILTQHGQLIGVSTDEVNDLINAVKFIKCKAIDMSIDERVKSMLVELCERIGYEPTESMNANRYPETIAKRDAIAKIVFDSFDGYGNAYHIMADFFAKDRTTILSQEKRVKNRLETKDPIFMRYYSELINFEKQVA